MVTLAIVALMWTTCGFVAWCACLADFYEIDTRYPMLGAADELWEFDGRSMALPIALLVLVSGPLGLAAVAIATGGFRHGFRVW